MDLVLSETIMLLLFTVLPLMALIFVIVYIRNWMRKQTKLKEEQIKLLEQIANQSK